MLERWSDEGAESDWSEGLKYSAVKFQGTAGLIGGVRGPRLGLTLLSLALLLTWLYSRLKVCISRRRHWRGDKRKRSVLTHVFEHTCARRAFFKPQGLTSTLAASSLCLWLGLSGAGLLPGLWLMTGLLAKSLKSLLLLRASCPACSVASSFSLSSR